ncbi:hypothetical protein [Chryseobacterium sp. T20]|uniref:hypothetical protein n=1 Tax=Chryseobacterium sp. T20 TaxID=3395375 RepID=UPI0039BC9BAB
MKKNIAILGGCFASNRDNEILANIVFDEKHFIKADDNALKTCDLCSESSKIIAEQLKQLRFSYNLFQNIENYKKKNE